MSKEYTRAWWKERLHLIQAFAEGKTVESISADGKSWIPSTRNYFSSPVDEYRIAPEPKLRPWKPEEVPAVALYMHGSLIRTVSYKDANSGELYLHDILVNPESLLKEWKHSTDGGRTWAPCGVMEEQP